MAEVIVALDLPTVEEAMAIAESLPSGAWVKVGPVLYVGSGPVLIGRLRDMGLRVFLDLKWHDIPATVAGAVRAARRLGIDLATVHALGGADMVRAAAEAADGLRLAAVTVLTSHDAEGWATITGRAAEDLQDEVARLSRDAVGAGAGAVVSSPREVRRVREVVPEGTWTVVPGVRPVGSDVDDQRRVATPRAAVEAGATHLVVGRPITRSDHPRGVYEEICQEVGNT